MNQTEGGTDLHHFDLVARALMRGRRMNIPAERGELARYVSEQAAETIKHFNDPAMAQIPESVAGRSPSDPEVLGFFRRRFRASLAQGLRLEALAEKTGQEKVREIMDNVCRRSRVALSEIELGASGRFGHLLPSAMRAGAEAAD